MLLHRNWSPCTTKPSFEWESPTRTGSLLPIPLEIYSEILSYLKPSQDDAFTNEDHMECFLSLIQVCKLFATLARPVIWGSLPFRVTPAMSTGFATSVAKDEPQCAPLAGLIKKCCIGEPTLRKWRAYDAYLKEDGFGETLAAALARMPVEELTITDVVLTRRVLDLVKVLAPRLKVLKIMPSCSISDRVSDDELKDVFGAMRGLEDLNITGRASQYYLMQSPPIIPVSNLRRLYTDALLTMETCIAEGAALTHLEIDSIHVLGRDTDFLYARLQAFPSLTHIWIHDVITSHFGHLPMDIPVDNLPNLISFKAPPGILPKFFGLGPKLQVLDSTGTNSKEPYADSSHPSSNDFTPTNIRELVVFDCNLHSEWVVPPVEKPVPNLRLMRVIYTGTSDNWLDEYTVPKMFEELGTMCEARTTRFPVEELVITFKQFYFTSDVGQPSGDYSWAVDLKQQLKMIDGLADGLPKLKKVLFHGGFVAWVKDEEDGGKWKPRMLNAERFDAVRLTMEEIPVVDYLGCLEPFL